MTSGGGGGDRREAKGAGRSEEDISVSSPSRLSPRFHGRGAVPPALREAGVRAALSPLPSPTAPGARRFARSFARSRRGLALRGRAAEPPALRARRCRDGAAAGPQALPAGEAAAGRGAALHHPAHSGGLPHPGVSFFRARCGRPAAAAQGEGWRWRDADGPRAARGAAVTAPGHPRAAVSGALHGRAGISPAESIRPAVSSRPSRNRAPPSFPPYFVPGASVTIAVPIPSSPTWLRALSD